MHQPVMIRPAADAIQPLFKQAEFTFTEFRVQILQQQNGGGSFLEDRSREEFVCHPNEEIKIMLTDNFFSALPHSAPKSRRIPSMRRDLFLEKPLHPRRMLRRPAVLEYAANLGRSR